jgi:hypothetical protein
MVKCCAGVGAAVVSSSFAEVSGLQPPKLFCKFNAKYCGMVHSKTTMASENWVKITDRL